MKTSLALITALGLLLFGSSIAATKDPGYLDFSNSAKNSISPRATINGHLKNGIFEPGYVNYHFDAQALDPNKAFASNPTAAGKKISLQRKNGHINSHTGIFEPGYVNYRFDR